MLRSILFCRRCLTLALLLLTFVSGAWGDDYIHYRNSGTTDNWTVSDALKYKVIADNIGSVTIHLEAGVYEFFFKQPGKTFHFASPIEVVDGNVYLLTESDKNNGKLTVATAGDYTFTVTWDGSTPYIRVDFPEDPNADKSFYLIVPNENVGNTERAVPASKGIAPKKHTAFKLTAGRERNKSELNADLVSINLKIDGDKGQQLRYDKNGVIRFYIKYQDKYFQPEESENEFIIGEGTDNKKVMATNGVDFYGIRSHNMSPTSNGKYYTIHKNDADDTKSLTFMFSKQNGPHTYKADANNTGTVPNGNAVNGFANNGNLIVGFLQSRGYGSTYYNEHISNGNVYLIGQMGENYTSDTKYLMDKIIYPDGATEENADSIVYVREVKKGSNSWDNFFLSFSTGDKIGNEDKHWNLLLRPHVQDQMDGQSLEGGVFFYKDDEGTDNQQQALNPLLTDDQKKRYVSYKVYFNATYSTYRVEFYDNFYIAGPAVNGIAGDNTNNSEYFKPEYRIAMQTETHHGVTHYKYTGEFKQGSTFAFFVNPETYALNYSEDADVADEAEGDMWHTQTPADNMDYAFHNHIRWNTDGDNDKQSLGEGNNGILWTLPSGTYTLRLYYHAEEANHNQLITIDKVVKLKNATSEFAESEGGTKESHNYCGWRTFSDDCALWLPNGVRAFYVSEVTDGKARLAEVTDGIIPAHCGVLLYDENLLEGEEEIHLYPVPTDYSQTLPAGTTNLLVDCFDTDKNVQPTENNKYNYFFTCFYKKIGDRRKSNVPMNFWKTVENAVAKKNYTYLNVPTDIHPKAYDSEHCNYLQELLASNIANNAKNYCFLLSLDDVFGTDTPMGIEVPEDNVLTEKGDVWFNMQGVRIAKPNTPGIYIHNRKKVVIR